MDTRDSNVDFQQQIEAFGRDYAAIVEQIRSVIVGHERVIDEVLTCLLSGGHVLLEGVPGLGKTLLVRTLADVLDLSFSRIQFTPDLMPADITGTNIVATDESGAKRFTFQSGPIFANLILADEINRATPKTQS
ncbi:MAG: AAA family ATPase, partial [Phycisphaerae bacterium]|nr:AAA family ATPase [Phycisphaerae bacterium]